MKWVTLKLLYLLTQTGTTWDDLKVNLTEVSRQAVSESAVDIGNSFTYELILDLPIIAKADMLNMTAEFFAVNTVTGSYSDI